jgi:hypothetical protein
MAEHGWKKVRDWINNDSLVGQHFRSMLEHRLLGCRLSFQRVYCSTDISGTTSHCIFHTYGGLHYEKHGSGA